MTLDVECYAGYRGEEEPLAFAIDGEWLEVTAVANRWAGPDHRYFKVMATDGHSYVLRHDEHHDVWTLSPFMAH
jgi:hypothetical protein